MVSSFPIFGKYSHFEFYFRIAYKIGREDPLIYEEFGSWSPKTGLIDLRTTPIVSKRRRDLRGHRLVVATVFMDKGSENHTDLDDYQYAIKILHIDTPFVMM